MPDATPDATPTAVEQEQMRLRHDIGLRADLAWVRQVAADPTARSDELTIPLLPAEKAELHARGDSAAEVVPIVRAEADLHPADYGGDYLDNEHGGAFTSLWRANLLMHEAAIRLRVSPFARVAFRSCTFSQADLNALMDKINADSDGPWLRAIPAAITGAARDDINDGVEIDISSANPNAAALVMAHYASTLNLPPGILTVVSDGNGAALRPWGAIRLTVLGPDGKPIHVVNSLYVEWAGDLPNLRCGIGDVGYGISSDGTPTELPCQAGRWRISIDTGPDTPVLGSASVLVAGGKTVELRLKISAVPPPRT